MDDSSWPLRPVGFGSFHCMNTWVARPRSVVGVVVPMWERNKYTFPPASYQGVGRLTFPYNPTQGGHPNPTRLTDYPFCYSNKLVIDERVVTVAMWTAKFCCNDIV